MTSEIRRIDRDQSSIRALLPVQGSKGHRHFRGSLSSYSKESCVPVHAGPNVDSGHDQPGEMALVPHALSHARRVQNKDTIMLFAERTVERRLFARHRKLLRAVIDTGRFDLSDVPEGVELFDLAGHDPRMPTRVVIENLYEFITDSHESDSRRSIEGVVAEVYKHMAYLSRLNVQGRGRAVDIYA